MKRLMLIAALLLAVSDEVRSEGGFMGSAALSGAGQGLSSSSSQMMSVFGAAALQEERFNNQQFLQVQHEFRALSALKMQLDSYAAWLDARAERLNKLPESQAKRDQIATHNQDVTAYQGQVVAYNQRQSSYAQWKASLGF